MGTTTSSPQDMEERRQRQLMEKLGVLIPPSFGVGTDAGLPPSTISMLHPSPSYLYSLEHTSACHRLLHEHMTPGLWVSASTPMDASVLAAFYVRDDSNEGMLSASQSFRSGKASIRAYTSEVSLVSGEYSPTCYLNIMGNVNAKGMSWLKCDLNPTKLWNLQAKNKQQSQQYYRNNPFADEPVSTEKSNTIQNLQLGTSLQVKQASNKTKASPVQIDNVLGYASIQISNCTVAMETIVPLKTLDPQVSYYFSANLNAQGGPPLIVSMQNTPTRSVMNLSQILTFDRIVVNALETRCPRIRNTFGWAVQMEKHHDKNNAQLAAGVAWQINRGIGVKVVAKNSGMTGALLLKRWKQPRVLCSLLASTAVPGRDVQFNIGLELETGTTLLQDVYNDTEERRVDDNVPATKATLPEIGVIGSL